MRLRSCEDLPSNRLKYFAVDEIIALYKKDVDRTLLRENLKLTPEQRVRKLEDWLRSVEELRRAGRELRRSKR